MNVGMLNIDHAKDAREALEEALGCWKITNSERRFDCHSLLDDYFEDMSHEDGKSLRDAAPKVFLEIMEKNSEKFCRSPEGQDEFWRLIEG